jgi:hypothetical protein
MNRLTWMGPTKRIEAGLIEEYDTDVWVIDEQTGIVYQGCVHEGTGDLQSEVELFLEVQ